jgi:restriction system protein
MALWMVRAGRQGEHESRFFAENRIYVTWRETKDDLHGVRDKKELREVLTALYPSFSKAKISNHVGQIGAFLFSMEPGDLVIVPRKGKAAMAIGKIEGPYEFHPDAEMPYRHSRRVTWLNLDVPRGAFDQDLLFSLGAIMTICEISRNDAERRVREMVASGYRSMPGGGPAVSPMDGTEEAAEFVDLERLARDQIAKVIIRRFKGHDMTRLVDALLKAQGYTTFISPPGPDKGIDILAAPGPLGFGRPRICVQVKSQESPVDTPTLNQLIGSMQNVHANQGLLVAWGGFKTSVDREVATQFFRVRLWDSDALMDQLLDHYDKLDEDLRTELPLKRVWTLAAQEEED